MYDISYCYLLYLVLHNLYIHFGINKDVDEKDLLAVTKIDLEKNVVLIKGSVPGANNSFVIVSNGVKANTPSVNPAAFEKGE